MVKTTNSVLKKISKILLNPYSVLFVGYLFTELIDNICKTKIIDYLWNNVWFINIPLYWIIIVLLLIYPTYKFIRYLFKKTPKFYSL